MSEQLARAIVLESDLFFVAKITALLRHAGYEPLVVRDVERFVQSLAGQTFVLALVNGGTDRVDWQGAIRAAHEAQVPSVAYIPHVDTSAQAEARALGATTVIANSKLTPADLPAILKRARQRGIRSTSHHVTEETQNP